MANDYSRTWFETFMGPFPRERTAVQLAFLSRQLPLPQYRRILDVCSGPGRIAGPLSRGKYEVTAVERDRGAIAEGQAKNPEVKFVEMDVRRLGTLPGEFDAAICLWQSFGYFDSFMNKRMLADMAEKLSAGGRLVLDIYDLRYFSAHQGVVSQKVAGREIQTRRRVVGKRLKTTVEYEAGRLEEFDWELFTPRDITELGIGAGIAATLVCADFDEGTLPAEDKASFQVVFQKG